MPNVDKDRLLDLPLGRINPAFFQHKPKVKSVSGKQAAMVLMTAQLALDPNRMRPDEHKHTRSHVKPNAAARRKARWDKKEREFLQPIIDKIKEHRIPLELARVNTDVGEPLIDLG